MSSDTLDALAFAPTKAALEDAISYLGDAGTGSGSAVSADARRAAFARFEALPAPGDRPNRGWRHDYAKLKFDDLRWSSDRMTIATLPSRPRPVASNTDELDLSVDQPALATENAGGLFHLGSTFLDHPKSGAVDARVTVMPLADALRAHPELVQSAAGSVAQRGDKFTALAGAFQNCGAFVHVPAGVQLDAPIQLVFAHDGDDAAVFPHIVVVLGDGARATVIERHEGEADAFICGIVEVVTGANARLDYVAVQRAGEGARSMMTRGARSGRDAVVAFHIAELGGVLVRSVVDAELDAEGSRAETSALFFNTGFQHVDLVTETRHAVGNTTSDVVVRTAASDRGQGRFHGNIIIEPKAHGSDASLRDDALLLSKGSHIDSVPALEIAANDVKAFHGATVGSLDADALFYASSRGIPRGEAVRMIALAFFEPAISRFPGDALRDEVRTALDRKIDTATDLDA